MSSPGPPEPSGDDAPHLAPRPEDRGSTTTSASSSQAAAGVANLAAPPRTRPRRGSQRSVHFGSSDNSSQPPALVAQRVSVESAQTAGSLATPTTRPGPSEFHHEQPAVRRLLAAGAGLSAFLPSEMASEVADDTTSPEELDSQDERLMEDETDELGEFADEDEEFVPPFSTFTWKEKTNFLFEGVPPSFHGIDELAPWVTASTWCIRFMLLVVVLSCVSFGVETLPQYYNKEVAGLFAVEVFCVTWFTVDLVVRFVTSPSPLRFFLSPMNCVDLVSVLPFFVDVAVYRLVGLERSGIRALVILRILRLTRLVRVMKLSRHSIGMGSIYDTVIRSQAALSLMFFLLFIGLMLGGAAVFFLEQTEQTFDEATRRWVRPDGSESPFQSVFHSLWFAIVTITTVGYGDHRIESHYAQAADAVLMLIGVFVIAFPTVILSSNFHDVHNSRLSARDAREEQGRRDEEEGANAAAQGATPRSGRTTITGPVDADADVVDPELLAAMRRRRRQPHLPGQMEHDSFTSAGLSSSPAMSFGGHRSFVLPLMDDLPPVPKELTAPSLDYRVPGEPPRSVYILDFCARYAPLLTFVREDGEMGAAFNRPFLISVHQNYPAGVIVGLQLQLHTRLAHEAAESAVRASLPDAAPHIVVEPRPVKKLSVAFSSSHPYLRDASLVTKVFRNPRGTVPVHLYLTRFDALPVFLRYSVGACFTFDIVYADSACDAGLGGQHLPVLMRRTRGEL